MAAICGHLQLAAVFFQVFGDTRGPKAVTTDVGQYLSDAGAAAHLR